MVEIEFKVSARAGKLLGRENFSNPEGAIIELVKNSYDADAKNCFVFFDIPTIKIKNDDGKEIIIPVKEKSAIYLIDNGEGMSEETIKKYWMIIGTGNKEDAFISQNKRVKTGAKGIGRFALDRLGYKTDMWTISNKKNSIGVHWEMDWTQFDDSEKSISDIKAKLAMSPFDLKKQIHSILGDHLSIAEVLDSVKFNNGTLLKISNLKDDWFKSGITDVFKSLEALIPPKELNIPFNVHFLHLQSPKEYGIVETAFFNDFDYKLKAKFDPVKLSVNFQITRDELDLKLLNKDFPGVYDAKKEPFSLKTIKAKTFSYNKPIEQVLKWKLNASSKKLLQDVGKFDLTFYYLKFTNSSKEGYPYRRINSAERKAVMDKFGGVKIYRDSFRVRPYGDPTNDWLRLGARVAQSPAGSGQRIGDWRVRPEQTAGIISISRKSNPLLIDKSDRGSLQENEAFETFKKIIVGVINEFEVDRSMVLNPIYLRLKILKEQEKEREIQSRAEKLADLIVEERKKVDVRIYGKINKLDLFQEQREEEEKRTYEKTFKETFQLIEEESTQKYNEELVQVRALASLGLIMSSFAHELKEIKNNTIVLGYLESVYNRIVPNELKEQDLFTDGLDYIEIIKIGHEKIKHWIDYSLNSIKKDRRKRIQIKFSTYLNRLKSEWLKLLKDRDISFDIINTVPDEEYDFRGFEMDLNTIFANLINNSVDSFKELNTIVERQIKLTLDLNEDNLEFNYSDNGVGLSNVFSDPNEIFLPFTTTKKDRNGNDIGTGLGMYLLKNTIEDYNGSIEVQNPDKGFSIQILIPIRKQKHKES